MALPIVKEVVVETGSTGEYFRVKIVHDDGSEDILDLSFDDKNKAIEFAKGKSDEYGAALVIA